MTGACKGDVSAFLCVVRVTRGSDGMACNAPHPNRNRSEHAARRFFLCVVLVGGVGVSVLRQSAQAPAARTASRSGAAGGAAVASTTAATAAATIGDAVVRGRAPGRGKRGAFAGIRQRTKSVRLIVPIHHLLCAATVSDAAADATTAGRGPRTAAAATCTIVAAAPTSTTTC